MPKSSSPDAPPPDQEGLIEFYSPDNYEPTQTVGYMMKDVHYSVTKMIDAEMHKHDLTAMQWRPLLIVFYGKATTAAGIAKQICMDTGATTRMLDRLEKKGLLVRTRCAHDRRVVNLALTDEGRRICESIPTDLCKVMNHHLKGFTQQEVDTLKSLLNRMLVNGHTT